LACITYPTVVNIGGEKIRNCWWKHKFSAIPNNFFDILFPDKIGIIQPTAMFRPRSKVTVLKVSTSYFHSVFNISELSSIVTHVGLSFNAKITVNLKLFIN